ncbi:MAG: ElyC/SanA/YdcF family protein [Flavobacteriaceae bacterium]|nr:ElyC/SanA/YdcF family protein [Flavobacteriaceae bacterium]
MGNKTLKRIFLSLLVLILILFGIIFGSYYWIKFQSYQHLTDDVTQITPHKTALVLGTSKRVIGGRTNLFFKYRMEAVYNLFSHNKIEYIIVSGDNSLVEYNETRDMRLYLLNLGVPDDRIISDFAGFRTLDSVIRAKEVFGQESLIIVSQPFHNERAVFIAKNHGIDAIGYNARSVNRKNSIKTFYREYLARVKCMIDIYILHTMPKYYKEKENFPD